ncbi:MAG: phosphoenolpyruvate--protein phosphotransferase [Mycoplasma sp.]|nr:phosphoenolpyruvate--protein phosphotransferase [Mycoplasma sp.]
MNLKGIGASRGIAIARVFELKHYDIKIDKKKISNVEQEIQKLESSIKNTVEQIEKIKQIASKNLDAEHAAVFDAHIQVATDPMMKEEMIEIIKNESLSAEYAVDEISKKYINMFSSMDDEYMKERAADIQDVCQKMIFNLLGIVKEDLTSINEEVIIVGVDLTPSETSQLNKKYVKGFATDIGGRTSHSAIMARSLEIPAVLGIGDITKKVKTGDIIAINGTTGEVFVNPSKELQDKLKKDIEEEERLQKVLETFKDKPSISKDGHHVEIAGNIGSPQDVPGVLNANGDAVGLFRSEFLYMDSNDWPNEEEQYQAYKTVLEKMNGKKVIIRTLDIGGDKILKYFTFPTEMNPFLGYRAIRFCLDRKDVFKTQLRALIRASEFGKLGIMFPMIATVDEFKNAKEFYNEVYNEVKKDYPNVSSTIEVGMMVEIPAAAVNSENFCKYADFVSIGTNDLIQYTMAADRMSEKVSYLYQPLNPSILRLIKMTIDGAHKNGKWAGMCGEMAGDLQAIPVLLGLGLDEFSMSASSILSARELISRINFKDAQEIANKCLLADNEEEVIKVLENNKKW